MNNMDWDLIKAFLSVAEHGSLSEAARQLGISQPSLSRYIQELENQLQLNLFKRTTQGLLLTEQGHRLVEASHQMRDAAEKFQRQASGLSTELKGDVRISANEIVGRFLLPAAIAAFQQQHPGVQIEIVISNQVTSLSRRDADIALRMFRPEQPDLVARRLPDLELGFYASQSYVEQYGSPESFDAFLQHRILGFDQDMSFIEGARHMGYTMTKTNFAIRSDDLHTHYALIKAGAGIGVLHRGIAELETGLVELLKDVHLPVLEFWCVCHSDVQYNSRIRETMQFLINWFKENPYHSTIH